MYKLLFIIKTVWRLIFSLTTKACSLAGRGFHMAQIKIIRNLLKSILMLLLVVGLTIHPNQVIASIVAADPCYSPLELAALFSSGKNKKASYESRIKAKEAKREQKEKLLERLEDGGESEYSLGISDFIDELGNSLDKKDVLGTVEDGFCVVTDKEDCKGPDETKDSRSKVATALAGYMELKENGWDCEKCGTEEAGTDCRPGCRKWQKDEDSPYFKSKGKIDKGFCAEYAADVSTCQSSLRKLKTAYTKKNLLLSQIEKLTVDIENLYMQKEEQDIMGTSDENEGSAFCLECLEDLRDLNSPGWGEIAGNTLLASLGVGLSVFGVAAGREAQDKSNELLALQGHPAENNFGYSLAGASLGLPYIQQGIYGLTQGNAASGGYGCSQTGNPYASQHAMMQHQYQMQHQHQYQMQGSPYGYNPLSYLFGGNPGFQIQGQGNLFPNAYGNAYAYGNPAFQAHGNLFGGPYGNPAFQAQGSLFGPYGPGFQVQAQGNPYGPYANPMFQAQGNLFGGPYGNPAFQAQGSLYGPSAHGNMMPGMNPLYMNQQAQHAMQQMQLQMQYQQAAMAQQQSIQQDWMERVKVINSMKQEIAKIESQMYMVASSGVGSFSGNISATGSIGNFGSTGSISSSPGAPQPSPSSAPSSGGSSDELPIVITR